MTVSNDNLLLLIDAPKDIEMVLGVFTLGMTIQDILSIPKS